MISYSRPTLIAASLWFVAFLMALYPFNALDLEFFGGCILLLYIWSYLLLAKGLKTGWDIPQSRVLLFSGLFFLLAVLSLFWSDIKPVTLLTICLFSAMPITFLTFAVRPDDKAYRLIAYAFVPLFFTLGVWAIIQYYLLHDYFYGHARHPLEDPASLGALLSLGLFGMIGWMFSGAKTSGKIIALIVALALIGGIYATAARGPVFAFIPGIALMLVLLWPRVKVGRRYALALLLGIVLVPMIMQMTGGPDVNMSERVGETLSLELNNGDVSNSRIYLWKSAIGMIKDHPFLGTGLGTTYQYLPEYKDAAYPAAAYHVHSDPLEYWIELGLLGVLLFYAFVIAATLRTFQALKKAGPEHQGERLVTITIFCALLSMVVHTHVSFNLYNLSILMITGFMLAVWFFATARILNDKIIRAEMPAGSPAILNMSLLALPFLMIGGLFFCNIAAEHYTNKARDNLFEHDMMAFAENVNKAGKISNGLNYRHYLLAVNVPLTLLEVNKSTMNEEGRRKLYDQAVGYMNTVLAVNPRNDSAYYYQAKAQELAGPDAIPEDAKKPEELYREAMRLNPMHLGARLALFQIYKKEGRPRAELIAVLEPAANMRFNSPVAMEFYKQLASLYLEDGNYGKVKEIMARMELFKIMSRVTEKLQSMSIPEALMRGEVMEAQPFPQREILDPETSGKTDSAL